MKELLTLNWILGQSQELESISELNQKINDFRSLEDEYYKNLLIPSLAENLSKLTQMNDTVSKEFNLGSGRATSFDAQFRPEISIQGYLERIVKYTPCSKECFLLAAIYIDRIIQTSDFLVTPFNVHRILITSIMLAAKLFDDIIYNNKYYSLVAGVPVQELNALELQLLLLLDHNLFIEREQFEMYRFRMEKCALQLCDRLSLPESVVENIRNQEEQALTVSYKTLLRKEETRNLRRTQSSNHLIEESQDTKTPRIPSWSTRGRSSSLSIGVAG